MRAVPESERQRIRRYWNGSASFPYCTHRISLPKFSAGLVTHSTARDVRLIAHVACQVGGRAWADSAPAGHGAHSRATMVTIREPAVPLLASRAVVVAIALPRDLIMLLYDQDYTAVYLLLVARSPCRGDTSYGVTR